MTKALRPRPLVLDDPLFPDLKDRIIHKTGLAYYQDKDADLARILAGRLSALGLQGCGAYADCLSGSRGQAEMDELVSELTIGETYFFRHPEVFSSLRQVILPEIIAANRESRALRIWSAGCSTGAEPYSISILLKEHFSAELAGWQAVVTGTDIDKKYLAFASRAQYQEWALRATPEPERSRYFEQTPSGWQLRPAFRKQVSFHHHNLIRDALPNSKLGLQELDIILCRNVAIYFSRDQINDLMNRFHASLNPNGWLITGPAEIGMDRPGGFQPVNLDGLIVYRKSDQPVAGAASVWTAPVLACPALQTEPTEPLAQSESVFVDVVPTVQETSAEDAASQERELMRLADRGQWVAALGLARRVIEREDSLLEARFKAVQVLAEAGDMEQAVQALKRLLFIDRRCQLAHYHLGLLLSSQGDRRMARKAFMNAYDLAVAQPVDEPVPGGEGLMAGQLADMALLRSKHEGAL
jgi:chemotaxis protein methyltransferase CheR